MNWKAQLGIGLLVISVAVAGIWMWRDSVWREKIASTPALRDTTITIDRDTVYVPKIQVSTILVSRVDSTPSAPRWWTAVADTTIEGISLHVEYNSPLPLAARGFFSDFSIQLPPRIDSVRTVYVTVRQTVIEERMAWEWLAGAGAAGVILGTLIAGGI